MASFKSTTMHNNSDTRNECFCFIESDTCCDFKLTQELVCTLGVGPYFTMIF